MWSEPHTIKGTTKAAEDDVLDNIIAQSKSNYWRVIIAQHKC